MPANATTIGSEPQTDIHQRYLKAMRHAGETLHPGDDTRSLLQRIRWLAAAQDGSYDTAYESLLAIDDLAAKALQQKKHPHEAFIGGKHLCSKCGTDLDDQDCSCR
jgi:hypothetical protein